MNKSMYEVPMYELLKLSAADVVTLSNDTDGQIDNGDDITKIL